METLLFVDACIRGAAVSRTHKICTAFLESYQTSHPGSTVTTVCVSHEHLVPFDTPSLENRDLLIKKGELNAPRFRYAHHFSSFDKILIGAPYWDMSFPAALKAYIEHICVEGITFRSTPEGLQGLCKAEKLMYITTAGASLEGASHGFDYFKSLCKLLGIPRVETIAADGLDLAGADIPGIMEAAITNAKKTACTF